MMRILDPVLLGVAYHMLQSNMTEDVVKAIALVGVVVLVKGIVKKLQQKRLRSLGEKSNLNVIIIGSGMSGIAMAYKCTQLGLPYTILESHKTDIGGTWRDNVYPGCSCDVATPLYSFSFEPNFRFSAPWVPYTEVKKYLDFVVDKHGIRKNVQFDSYVEKSVWDETTKKWTVHFKKGDGSTKTLDANVVVTGCGQLRDPQNPPFDCSEFKGTAMHTATWDNSVPLEGKRIACIGTGASAIQLVPAVAEKAKSVTVFQRSPGHLYKKWQFDTIAPVMERVFYYSRFLQIVRRLFAFIYHEVMYHGFVNQTSPLHKVFCWYIRYDMSRQFSKKSIAEKITPPLSHDVGSKRILITRDWIRTLEMDKVETVTDNVEKLVENGVLLTNGRVIEADIVAYATGFKSQNFILPMDVIGRGGKSLKDAWEVHPAAYRGIAVPDYPNFFHLYGPGSNLGHSSIIFMIEQQTHHIGLILEKMILRANTREPIATAEVTEPAFRAEQEYAKQRMTETVWGRSSVKSWYLNKEGYPVNNWYGSCYEYKRVLAKLDKSAWTFAA